LLGARTAAEHDKPEGKAWIMQKIEGQAKKFSKSGKEK